MQEEKQEKQFNKQDYFDLEHVIEDLELMHEQYKETKEELYQLNVKHGALLCAVYSMRSFLTKQQQDLQLKEKSARTSETCKSCYTNEQLETVSARVFENFVVQVKFDKLFKDLI